MRFSIAVPSFQYGRFLRDCLKSIETQRYDDFEVLIADGGSTDESLGIIDEFVQRDPRFKLVSRADEGQADALRRAFAAATGDIQGFLNADDVFLDEHVLRIVGDAFEHHENADLVSGAGRYLDSEGRLLGKVRLRYHPLDTLRWMRWRTAVLQPATFWRRGVADSIPLRTGVEYSFDSWFFYDAWAHGFQFHELATELAGYRLHGNNKSMQVSPERVRELARFEDHKFGPGSFRGRYLGQVASVLTRLERLPRAAAIKRAVYAVVNSVSFASAYRLPSI